MLLFALTPVCADPWIGRTPAAFRSSRMIRNEPDIAVCALLCAFLTPGLRLPWPQEVICSPGTRLPPTQAAAGSGGVLSEQAELEMAIAMSMDADARGAGGSGGAAATGAVGAGTELDDLDEEAIWEQVRWG